VNRHGQGDGSRPPIAHVHGELFGANGLTTVPDNPRGSRSKSIENRCKGKGDWNTYDVVCVDGAVKLAVNGKFVNRVFVNGSRREGVGKAATTIKVAVSPNTSAPRGDRGDETWPLALTHLALHNSSVTEVTLPRLHNGSCRAVRFVGSDSGILQDSETLHNDCDDRRTSICEAGERR
jgi:hypothetical protein